MMPTAPLTELKLAQACRELALDKKAVDPVILDLRKLNGPSSMFLICSGDSDPQLKAIADSVSVGLKQKYGLHALGWDGRGDSQWMVLDYGSVLVHILRQEKRRYYNLEGLWSDAKRIP